MTKTPSHNPSPEPGAAPGSRRGTVADSADAFPYRLLFEHANDAVFISDLDDRILDANHAACRLYGYSRDELLAMRINDLQAPERRAPAGTVIRDEIDRYGGRAFETTDIRKTGERIDVEVTTTLIQTAHGRLALSIARDVSDRKKIEQALRDSQGELRRLNVDLEKRVHERTAELEQARERQAELAHVARLSTMGEMASGLAHELNQPLAAIMNYGSVILRRIEAGDDSASYEPAVQRVVDQARRAAEIIRRLRDFVAKRGLHRVPTDLSKLVLEVLPLIQPEARKYQIAIETDLAEGLPEVVVDPIQIEQVVVNLVLNAIEAIDSADGEGEGTDEVDGQRQGESPSTIGRGPITLGTSRVAAGVRLSVCDTGPGMTDQELDHVFDPFFTTKPGGMGMGLTISQSIVDSHGGRLWADRSAEGCTFCIDLPLASMS